MSADGWVKLWRKMEDSDVWGLPPLTTRIWIWVLLHAAREAHTWRGITFEPGELFTSYESIAKGVAWSENRKIVTPSVASVRWSLKKLLQRQALQQEPQQGGLFIKVLHWEEYQGDKKRTTTGTTTGTTTEPRQDHDTIQEVKEGKEVKKTHMSPPSPERTVFEFWKKIMGKTDRTDFDSPRQTAVQRGLKTLTLDEALAAVQGCALTPHNMGLNDRETKYNDLTLIFRDASHWERFIETARGKSVVPMRTFAPQEEERISASLDLYRAGAYAEAQKMIPDELWLEVKRRGRNG